MQNRRQPKTDRDVAIAEIKAALKTRASFPVSVTGGKGTAWGWITIAATPRALVDGTMTGAQCKELAELLGLDNVHSQGELIPASSGHYREYVDRACGRVPAALGTRFWD